MSKFPIYNLTDREIRGIANIVLHEQGTVAGWYAEASQIANRTDIRGDSYATGANAVKTVTSGWYAKGKARYLAGTSDQTVIGIVRRVFCAGFRTLPRYIDEHDCMSDIATVTEGGKNVKADKSKWKRHTTIIKNKMGSTYRFYDFPGGYGSGVDPFGYTSNASRQKWGDFCYSLPEAIGIPTKLVSNLDIYHAYVVAHYQYFDNRYDPKMVSFSLAKQYVSSKKQVGLTCVVPLRWALYSLGIKGIDGKSLISAPGGSFEKYYVGDIKRYFDRIVKGGAVGKTVKQAVDGKLLKAGDIICFEKLTHAAVYSGKGYVMFEGGGACVKDGHYPNGIKLDYSKHSATRKIAEVLRCKESSKETSKETNKVDARSKVVNSLDMLIGIKEGSPEHKMIINTFNASGLCPRYKMTTKDAWCATTVSFAFIVTKLAGKPGSGALFQCVECSCTEMVKLAKKQGIWVESDTHVPAKGDVIMYDWQDSGKGDNIGNPDHVGIVEKVKDGVITVIEGNYKDAVGRRTIKVNAKGIRGYICPKYDKLQTTTTKSEPKKEKKAYAGKFPSLPPRGYYKHGDGFRQYAKYAPQIEKLQKLINWITGGKLTIDGQYGSKTEAEVKKAQGILGIKKDGLFGADTLAKARSYKK